jgi:ABC-2 type transport system permease protein
MKYLFSLYRKLSLAAGIDYNQLVIIVRTKLLLDNRRSSPLFSNNQQQPTTNNQKYRYTLLMNVFFGAFIGVIAFFSSNFLMGQILMHSFVLLTLVMTLIADYSSVLLDTSDNTILLPRPIDSKTLLAARIIHISIYLGQIMLSLALVPLIICIFKYGIIAMFILLISLLLNLLAAVFLTGVLYLLLLKYVSDEKIKDTINFMQIATSVFFLVGYQIIPRLLGTDFLKDSNTQWHWWQILLPPVWFSAPLVAWVDKEPTTVLMLASALGAFIPILGLWYANKYLSSNFTQKIANLSNETSNQQLVINNNQRLTFFSKYLTSSTVEQGAFQFTWKILSRDRKIKLKIYPQIASSFIFLLILILNKVDFQKLESIADVVENLKESNLYLLFIYFNVSIIIGAVSIIRFSDDYKAAWIYTASPIKNQGEILLASLKASLLKFFAPVYLITSALVTTIWGLNKIPDLIFGMLSLYITSIMFAKLSKMQLPFSEEYGIKDQISRTAILSYTLFLMAIPALIHYLFSLIHYLIPCAIPIQITAIYYLNKDYRTTKN